MYAIRSYYGVTLPVVKQKPTELEIHSEIELLESERKPIVNFIGDGVVSPETVNVSVENVGAHIFFADDSADMRAFSYNFV